MKIITVLKNDSAEEILELFRQAPAGEVIFVLPKKCKAFNTAGHFTAVATEAQASGKTVSVMAADTATAQLAKASGLEVVSAGKPRRVVQAKLASNPPPADEDFQDFSKDAFQDDVVVPSDERMNVKGRDELSEEEKTDPVAGMHVEKEGGEVLDQNANGIPDRDEEPSASDESSPIDNGLISAGTQASHAALAASVDGLTRGTRHNVKVPAPKAKTAEVPVQTKPPKTSKDSDYIDTIWRDRTQTKSGAPAVLPSERPKRGLMMSRVHLSGRLPRWMTMGLLVVALVVLGGVVYTVTGSAAVIIVPISNPIDLELNIQVSDAFGSVDADFLKLPGQRFSVTQNATASETATGSRDVASKARGTITISNEYSSSPQTLVATTRFADEAGHVFRTLQTITVPGSRVVSGKTIPGTVDVGVIADKPGEEYNIPPGKFIIVAFQERGDTERVNKLYGTSSEATTGGANGPSAVVTQENYSAAMATAQTMVRTKIQEALSVQAPGMRILDEQGVAWNPLVVSARPDDAAREVSVTARATLTTLAFRQEDLEELVRGSAMTQQRVVVVPDQLSYVFSDVQFNSDTGILDFTVRVQGPGYAPIDAQNITKEIRGKESAAIRLYFSSNEDIQSATLELSPPWVRSVPTKNEKIHVQIDYESPETP